MKISIITVTFNNFNELVKTCSSIPSHPNIEHIIINGGSCAQTREYLETQNHIKFISEPDKGISDAFNKGVQAASGQYIWFINSGDTLIDTNYIDYAVQNIESHNFIHADIIMNGTIKNLIRPNPNAHLIWGMPYLHPTMIVQKSAFDKVGLFNLDYKIAMDLDFVARLRKHGFEKALYYPHPVVEMDGFGVSNTKIFKPVQENISVVRRYSGWTSKDCFELIKVMIIVVKNRVLARMTGKTRP